MKQAKTAVIEAPPPAETNHALATTHRQEVGAALTSAQISERLRFIHQVMADNMKDGVDYGKVPGCGDKPGLFQPGAQKLSMTFQLNPSVREETIMDYPNLHRGYRFVVRVENGPKFADGVGECSTMESKYRFRSSGKKCPECGKETVLKSKNKPGEWFCWAKKGGCGANFSAGSINADQIEKQSSGKVEHDNPPDFWNTVRKMAFKRGFVHAIINATNTSELWSQDLEDLAANGSTREDSGQEPPPEETRYTPSLPSEQPKPTGKPKPIPAPATEDQRAKMFKVLHADFTGEFLLDFAMKAGILFEGEALTDWPLRYVPRTQKQCDQLIDELTAFGDGAQAKKPFINS